MENLKRTPLYDKHIDLGARMVPFAGWEMPVQYQDGILAEHRHTRTHASIFDICHMGEFRISGAGSAAALDKCLARAVVDQKAGTCRYNFLLTERGTVIDDLIVYRLAEEEFFIVVNAGTKDSDAQCLRERLSADVSFADESETTAKIDLQGPESVGVLGEIGFEQEKLPQYYRWIKTNIFGIPCLLSRTGYTGELGFEIYCSADSAGKMWDGLLSGKNIKPAGLGARDTLRLEMGYPLYGHELNLDATPVEAGFAQMLKLDSGRDFTGASALRNSRPAKKLFGIELDGRRTAREGTAVFMSGKKIGTVTSGTFSPSLGKAIAMAYMDSDAGCASGMKIDLLSGKNSMTGRISDLPFYRDGTAKI